MNVYDSERMGEALNTAGYHPVDAPDKADMVILNTCHIREKAAESLFRAWSAQKAKRHK